MFNKKIKKTLFFTAIISLITACAPAGPSFMQQRQMEIAEYSAIIKRNEENAKKRKEENKAAEAKRMFESQQDTDRQLAEIKARYERERDKIDREEAADKILRKKPGVKIGMTTSKVRSETSWGSPDKINRTSTRGVVTEQWVYHSGQYLYFRNNKLYAVQN